MKIIAFLLILVPLTVSAQFGGTGLLIARAGYLINVLTTVAAGAALLVFFWGLVKFILKAGDEKGVEEGRRLMLWGIIALFIMVSVWGLVAFIRNEIGVLPSNTAPVVPTFPRP